MQGSSVCFICASFFPAPTFTWDFCKTRAVSSLRRGLPVGRAVSPLSLGLPQGRAVSPLSLGLHQGRAVSPLRRGFPEDRDVSPLRWGFHEAGLCFPLRWGLPEGKAVSPPLWLGLLTSESLQSNSLGPVPLLPASPFAPRLRLCAGTYFTPSAWLHAPPEALGLP